MSANMHYSRQSNSHEIEPLTHHQVHMILIIPLKEASVKSLFVYLEVVNTFFCFRFVIPENSTTEQ